MPSCSQGLGENEKLKRKEEGLGLTLEERTEHSASYRMKTL